MKNGFFTTCRVLFLLYSRWDSNGISGGSLDAYLSMERRQKRKEKDILVKTETREQSVEETDQTTMALTSTGVDSAVEELGRLDIQSGFPQVLLQELRFMIKFLMCLSSFERADEDDDLTIAKDTLKAILKEAGYKIRYKTDDSDEEEELSSKSDSDEEEESGYMLDSDEEEDLDYKTDSGDEENSDAKADSDDEEVLDSLAKNDEEEDLDSKGESGAEEDSDAKADSDGEEDLDSKAESGDEEDSNAKAESDGEEVFKSMAHSLLNQFEKYKLEIEKICDCSLDSIKSMFYSSDEILNMVDCLVENFMDLSNLNVVIFVSVKDQILVLAKKLRFLRILVDFFPKRCIDQQILKDFVDCVKDLVHGASSFSLFGLLKGKDEIMAQGWRIILSDLLLQRFMHPTPSMIMKLLTASKSSRSDKFRVGEIVVGLVNFLLQVSPHALKDYVDVLKEELIIMITFLIEPEESAVTNAADELFTQVAGINEVLSLFPSLSIDKLSVDMSSLQGKIDKVKEGIRKLYVPSVNSTDFSFPRTNGLGFVNFFLEKLKDLVKYHLDEIPFAKHQLLIIHKELLSLEPFLKSTLELQKERDLEELKDLWGRIINLVFQADHVVSSCLIIDHPIWHDMLQLADLADALKIIEIEVRNNEDRMNKTRLPNTKIDSSQVLIKQTKPSSLEDVVVGLEDEKNSIIDNLNRGTKKLQIVSIVGMPGLGKTTIAQKVYNDLSIGYRFCKRAWCCVSQVYNRRELFFDILTDIAGVNPRQNYAKSTDDDLAEKLRKSLKQQRYLIVLDDIWDIKAWDGLKDSFPDDNKGSRIIFTSRIQNLGLQVKQDCSVHPLRPLSDEESWELLKLKLSHTHSSLLDDEQSEIGKQIAKNCNGVPLTVVLAAGILPSKDIEFWKDIRSQVNKGCMDVLKLSYNHLPDNLKPCFLYFGAFPEDRVVSAKKLVSLWIGEGLIPRDDKKSSFKIAKDYLSDLINRNLVILAERSSTGGIRACRVHDLLHDFCLARTREDSFLQRVGEGAVFQSSCDPRKYENYRLCIHADWNKFVGAKPSGRYVRTIVLVGDYGWKNLPCPYDFLNSFRLLNVLDLEGIKIDGGFPEEVTLMVNLRYLAIQCSREGKLPSSIAKLWNLEILIMKSRWGEAVELPRTFWQMKNLRLVSIGWVRIANSLKDNKYGHLERLEIFSSPVLADENETNELLRRLPGLRKFMCIFEHPSHSIRFSSLTQLESLHLINLTSGNWFPFDFPSSLRKLILRLFKLSCTAISIIGKLPNLEVLKLKCTFSGRRWNVEDGEFKALKFLELYESDIEQWTAQDDPFPSLERLVISHCKELGEIPSGLGYIPTLKNIKMRYCTSNAARSVEEILEEQKEMGNDILQVGLDRCFF